MSWAGTRGSCGLLAWCLLFCSSGVSGQATSWVEEVLSTLDLEQKVGQMILARASGDFLANDDPERLDLEQAVRSGRVGGAVIFAGDAHATARLTRRLQALARVPLLFASDYEWGVAMRVRGATRFPPPMAIGAGGRAEDAQIVGRITGTEARALGVHLVLAPVLDLATLPSNPVVNTRSFGAEPTTVGRLGVAFIRSLQEQGVLATAKHFPGHGSTFTDSHEQLAVLNGTRDQLLEADLRPFREAIEAGVAAVMPGHLAVPGLDARLDRPATLSPQILQGFLRSDLGFDGLIVSDALDMTGVREEVWDGEVAVRAIEAGVDLLIVPPDPNVAWQALRRAVLSGRLTERRLDQSVRRILRAKAQVGLHQPGSRELDSLDSLLGRSDARALAENMAQAALVWVSLGESGIPFSSAQPPSVLLIDWLPETGTGFDPTTLRSELERRAAKVERVVLSEGSVALRLADVLALSAAADRVVVAAYTRRSQPPSDRDGLGQLLRGLTRQARPVVLAAMRDPWELASHAPSVGLLAAFDGTAAAQRAVARALFEETQIAGRLPIALSTDLRVGHGVRRPARGRLARGEDPSKVGMSPRRLARATALLEAAVAERTTPGAVALVVRRGQVVLETAVGRLSYQEDSPPVTRDSIYDLASLTKVVATTTLAMMLVERGRLELSRRVGDYLPQFVGVGKDQVTVADLLAHSSGILWWTDLYLRHGSLEPKAAKNAYLKEIVGLPLANQPRTKTVYSDLALLVLGEILERVSGESLEVLARRWIFEPLAMSETTFRPSRSKRARIAPTEVDREWREQLIWGEVHDENAHGLGGVAAHAGLFSTTSDLAVFCQMLLNGGHIDGVRLLNGATIARFTRRAGLVEGSSRALGWDTPSQPSSAGRYFSTASFGHTGFTGTSIWIDPVSELFAILLTNRVHPTRENTGIGELRSRFHDAVMESIR